eukprot:c4643_g1_i2.p1 GENE.c4643_g1_i2~~c4643_g1_i2.p1  ORF type:complete len:343 (+),score=78.54 c4643_g1_i2:932-1960(+)
MFFFAQSNSMNSLCSTVANFKTKKFVSSLDNKNFFGISLTQMMELATADGASDFLEATIYNKQQAVIQVGNFVDEPRTPAERAKINGINHFWKPFYFKWVETFLAKGRQYEYVPLDQYYHRFTRSIFWELEEMIPFSNHPLYRYLWGWLGAPEVSLLKLAQGPVIRQASVQAHVVQESIMPIRYLGEGIERFDVWFGVYPLLVFPIRVYSRGELSGFLTPRAENLQPDKDWGMWVDLGAYGTPRNVKLGRPWDPKVNVRAMEHWTRTIGGWVPCYTDMFCTPKEFRQIFNHNLLDSCRKRFRAEDAFPEVYEKVRPEPGIVDLTAELQAESSSEANPSVLVK